MALMVEGLVKRPIDVESHAQDARRIERIEDFVCLEGWTRPDQVWSGFRLSSLIALAHPTDEARFVEVASGDFVAVLPLSNLEGALLADRQNGELLPNSSWLLVVSEGPCYNSVKNVDRITLVAQDAGETAKTIALARIEQ